MNTKASQTLSYKLVKKNADTLTPVGIFKRMTGKKKFLLESSFQHEDKGKYSYIGSDPYQEIVGHGNKTTLIDHETGETKQIEQNALLYLKENLPTIDINLPTSFTGGAIGYIGYDAIRQFENIGTELPDDLKMPDIHFMIYKNLIIYEHANETVYLVATNTNGDSEEKLDERLKQLESSLFEHTNEIHLDTTEVHFQPEIPKEAFIEKVKIAQDYIHRGEVLQVVLSQRMNAAFSGDPFTFYRKLRRANPSPYMFYIDFDDYLIVGASPESLIQTTGRNIVTNPIAGTRARAKTESEEQLLIEEFLQDKKEISEHKMLVELSQSDLSRVCEDGSITIPTYMKIEKYQHVMHIVSEVHGKLKSDSTSIDALIACLPAGTVSGAPKVRAMQIINDLEERKRGFYAGGIGYIGFNRDLNMALAIRSIVVKDGHAYLQAGAGIVADSVPEKEFNETLQKAKSLMEINELDLIS